MILQFALARRRRDATDGFAALPKQCAMLTRLTKRSVMMHVCDPSGQHALEQRAARWLLMMHDRADGDEFPTQEFLSMMLAVHRPAVNITARLFQQSGLISYGNGRLRAIDRPGLEASACLAGDDDVIEAFAADRSDKPLRIHADAVTVLSNLLALLSAVSPQSRLRWIVYKLGAAIAWLRACVAFDSARSRGLPSERVRYGRRCRI